MCSLAKSIFLYACDSWTLKAELQRRLQAMEMRCYRKILRSSYKDHVTNEEVRAKFQQAIGPHEDLLTIVERRKLQWYGHDFRSSHHLIYPSTARVVGAPQMISQPVSSIFFTVLYCPLGLSELQACPFPDVVFPPLPLSALSSSPFSLCLARWFWPDLMNGKHDHTTAVCVSLRWSGGPRVVQLPARPWHGLFRW